jgi:surfeit locus 1 family protein
MLTMLKQPRFFLGTIFVLIAILVTMRLGFWQVSRLVDKRAMNVERSERRATSPVHLPVAPEEVDLEQMATARGSFAEVPAFLLLNRSFRTEGGAELLSPFRLEQGGWILVNRGWVPQGQREQAPPPTGETVEIRGYIDNRFFSPEEARVPQLPPMFWVQVNVEAMANTLRAQHPEDERFADAAFLPYTLVMTEPLSEAWLPRPRGLPELTEGSHFSYAAQWFFFSGIFMIGWIAVLRLEWRRQKLDGGRRTADGGQTTELAGSGR